MNIREIHKILKIKKCPICGHMSYYLESYYSDTGEIIYNPCVTSNPDANYLQYKNYSVHYNCAIAKFKNEISAVDLLKYEISLEASKEIKKYLNMEE